MNGRSEGGVQTCIEGAGGDVKRTWCENMHRGWGVKRARKVVVRCVCERGVLNVHGSGVKTCIEGGV